MQMRALRPQLITTDSVEAPDNHFFLNARLSRIGPVLDIQVGFSYSTWCYACGFSAHAENLIISENDKMEDGGSASIVTQALPRRVPLSWSSQRTGF